MLPIIPFEVLLPLAMAATLLCVAVIVGIIGRRAVIKWWDRGGNRLTDQAERLIKAVSAGEQPPETLTRWLGRARSVRIDSFVRAVKRIESRDGEIRDWLAAETDVPERLGEIVASGSDGRSRRLRRERWTRVSAAQAVAALRLETTLPNLVRGIDDPDEEVSYAAAGALGRLNHPEGADAIMGRISAEARLNNSRLASFVENMTCNLQDVFRKHLQREDPQARYWSATLIGEKQMVELVEDVRPLLDSPNPNVRAAACECVGELRIPLTDRWVAHLMDDEMWFVQSHAAKALGQLGAAWAVEDLAQLLFSGEWWVRQNAADALIQLGSDSADAVEPLLWSEDRFARNTAVEVLERIRWIPTMLGRATRDDPRAVPALRQFGICGGLGYLENALFTTEETAIPILLEILRELGDDATYGRIRAAAEQMPERLRPHAYSVASEVQGR